MTFRRKAAWLEIIIIMSSGRRTSHGFSSCSHLNNKYVQMLIYTLSKLINSKNTRRTFGCQFSICTLTCSTHVHNIFHTQQGWKIYSSCCRRSKNLEFELRHDKTNNVVVRPAKTQISLGICPVWSVFAVRMKKAWVLSYPLSAQWRLIRLGGCPGWSKSSLGAQPLLGFVMSQLILFCRYQIHLHTFGDIGRVILLRIFLSCTGCLSFL